MTTCELFRADPPLTLHPGRQQARYRLSAGKGPTRSTRMLPVHEVRQNVKKKLHEVLQNPMCEFEFLWTCLTVQCWFLID